MPSVTFAGGITLEDQIIKAFAMGSPYVKAVGMARSSLAAAMVGKTIGGIVEEKNLPVYIERHGNTLEEIFVSGVHLKDTYGEDFAKEHPGGIGVYTYYQRLAQGMRQFMCGARKFSFEHISRDDIVALTKEASDITGITYVMDMDKEKAWDIIKG